MRQEISFPILLSRAWQNKCMLPPAMLGVLWDLKCSLRTGFTLVFFFCSACKRASVPISRKEEELGFLLLERWGSMTRKREQRKKVCDVFLLLTSVSIENRNTLVAFENSGNLAFVAEEQECVWMI